MSPNSAVYYRDRYWNDIPAVVEHLNRRATGQRHPGWAHHLLQHRGRPFERGLFLNTGNGWVERELVGLGIVKEAVGVEWLPDLIAVARSEAEQAGLPIRYHQVDINAAVFPGGEFDLVVNHAAGHHIAYIDRVFRSLARLLPSDGVFVSWDYVGPHRNQYPAAQWEASYLLNRSLPERFRSSLDYPHLPTMLEGDPTEAIHAELILPTIERYFHIDHLAHLGGQIGYLLLSHNDAIIDAPWDESGPWVERVMEADEAYVEADPGSTLFAYVLAHPDKTSLHDPEALARWTRDEEERESAAAEAGGYYYPATLIAALTYPDLRDLPNRPPQPVRADRLNSRLRRSSTATSLWRRLQPLRPYVRRIPYARRAARRLRTLLA